LGGRLPEAVLARRKAPLPGYPLHGTLLEGAQTVLGLASAEPRLAEFVDMERFSAIARRPQRLRPSEYALITRPLGLALWLSRLTLGSSRRKGDPDETGRRETATQALQQA